MRELSLSRLSHFIVYGLGILLAGCGSLNQKVNLSNEFPKQLVMSRLEIFHADILDKNRGKTEKLFSNDFLTCMGPLMDRQSEGDIFHSIFEEFNKISENKKLLGFVPEKLRKNNIQEALSELIKNNKSPFENNNTPDLLNKTFPVDLKRILDKLINLEKDSPVKKDQFEAIMKYYLQAYFASGESALGFVARDGMKYKFSGPTSTDGNISINHTQIGADLTRITLEAIRDTFFPIPVSKNSTLASLESSEINGLDVNTYDKNEGKKGKGFWKISETMTYAYNNVDFAEIETSANKAESLVATAVGKAIRGGSLGSLNNEALAKTIETAAGVLARHTTERAYWCNASEKNKANGQIN